MNPIEEPFSVEYSVNKFSENKLVLFVNSEQPPYKEIPLDHYRCEKAENEYRFSRLYKVVYRQDAGDGYSVNHSILGWRSISVKKHCVDAMKAVCDLMAGAREFIY